MKIRFSAALLLFGALLPYLLQAESPRLSLLEERKINGTKIAAEATLAGVVKDTKSGKGIAGVPVTDGYSYVLTDKNGVYQMQRNRGSRKAYYSLPAGYEVVLNEQSKTPEFFSPGIMHPDSSYRADFFLTPLAAPEERFTLIAIGDPQCANMDDHKRYVSETMADIKASAGNIEGPIYAVTLGDVTYDSHSMWNPMKSAMSNVESNGRYIPIFQCPGNHDHSALVADGDDRYDNDWRSLEEFVSTFGPTDYSFNRGNAHIVVMDDILVSHQRKSSKENGRSWRYQAGFTPQQYQWLKEDFENVADKQDKVLIFCAHIPFRDGSKDGGDDVNYDKFYNEFLSLFSQFGSVHIMIGHTHFAQNYLHKEMKVASGNPPYEHIHQTACGVWWLCNSSASGAPNGYTIYTVEGSSIVDWVNQATGKPSDFQMRVYDGNTVYGTAANAAATAGAAANAASNAAACATPAAPQNELNWCNPKQPIEGKDFFVKGSPKFKDAFVVDLWDDDDSYWTIELFVDGKKAGDFVRTAENEASNVATAAFFFNQLGRVGTYYGVALPLHLWYCRLEGIEPSKVKNWSVVATRTLPGGYTRSYTVSEFTDGFETF